jgi:putative ABC transport system permease protein
LYQEEDKNGMDTLLSDFRTALRVLAGRPAFTVVTVLTLALGIGANSAIFSVVNALLLRPLPYEKPEELVWVTNKIPQVGMEMTAGADYLDWRDGSRALASVSAFTGRDEFTWKGGEEPERLQGTRVSASFLPTLGVLPAQGRGFKPEEERLNAGRVAVLSHRLWERLFGGKGQPGEQPLQLDDETYTVVGVLPEGFRFPGDPEVDVLVPLALDEAQERGRQRMSIVQVIGRLAPGVPLGQVRAELLGIQQRSIEAARQAAEAEPGPSPGPPRGGPGGGGLQITMRMGGGPGPRRGGVVELPDMELVTTPLAEKLVGDVRPALLILLGAVGFVLLIACANVANLLLARATARRREIAIRAALGAGRGRIVRQLLTESVLLGLVGGAAGLLVAFAGVRLLVALVPADLWGGLLQQIPIGLDVPVLVFTFLLSVATGILFGLAPALSASRVDLSDPLKEGGKSRPARARGLLVAAEVALAVILLIGAGLLLRSFQRLHSVDPGFIPESVLTLGFDLPRSAYSEPAKQRFFFEDLARRAAALPGVESAAVAGSLPLTGFSMILRGLTVEGREPLPPDQQPEVGVVAVSPGYFETMGIRLLGGRAFAGSDGEGGAPVAVVSRSMARKFWGNADPVGRRLRVGPPEAPWTTVVGVVADVRSEGLEADPRLILYRPFSQQARPSGYLAVKTTGDPAALVRSVRAQALELDRNVPASDILTMEQRLAGSVSSRRFNLILLGLFAVLALALAGVGLYGVLAYAVTERTREIGIRMALGARRQGVLALVIRQGLTLAAVGVGVGLILSFAFSSLLRSSLFGVTTADPVTYVAIPLVLLLVALLSSYLPARRATRVDPMVALRNQ